MEFIPAAIGIVKSKAFAKWLQGEVNALLADKKPHDYCTAHAATLIAWTATGHDWSKPPVSFAEVTELAHFVADHATEIDNLGRVCFRNMAKAA